MTAFLWRSRSIWGWVLRLHRYLGMAVGVVVVAWCLSGIVMMYVPYPEWDEYDALRTLDPLDLHHCCPSTVAAAVADRIASLGTIDHFSIEMSGDRPVLRVTSRGGDEPSLDLTNGEIETSIPADEAGRIARVIKRRLDIAGELEYQGTVTRDQWTVESTFDVHRPLYRFEAANSDSPSWYISSRNGKVVQFTTGRQRFWNRLGAVVHWLYPTVLRQHVTAWTQTVIWLSLLAIFLTVTGLFIAVKQVRIRGSIQSPYRGLKLWHHYAGLVFGVFTLSWLLSGLLSVSPWGALDSRDFDPEVSRLRGAGIDPTTLRETVLALRDYPLAPNMVRVEGATFLSRPYLLVWSTDAGVTRLNGESLQPEQLSEGDLHAAAQRMRPEVPIVDAGPLFDDDAYYYRYHTARRLPVYRVRYEDGERVYLDPTSGDLLYAVDRGVRGYRWFVEALHRWDFLVLLRWRPLWDVILIVLLSGVTSSAVFGVILAARRVARARS